MDLLYENQSRTALPNVSIKTGVGLSASLKYVFANRLFPRDHFKAKD
jgi:hypothetical protein